VATAASWATRDEEWVRRAGFARMAGLAVHDKAADNGAVIELLPTIGRGAFVDRNFVKKAVNWALRKIGKRNRALNVAALGSAEQIRSAANGRAGGSVAVTRPRAARRVATEALSELAAEKIRARLER
jgi:3-methyladenine DNA glycosylase AlkD